MRIGELARSCHVNPKTVRYYEEFGLLPKPPRTASGHRIYGNEDLRRLQFIRRAKAVGLPLAAVRQIVPQAERGHCDHTRARLRELIAAQLTEIEHRMRELRALRATLRRHLGALANRLSHGTATRHQCACIDASEPEVSILPAPALVRRPRGGKSRPGGGEAT